MPYSDFVSEPAATFHYPVYVALISEVSIAGWLVAATTYACVASALRRNGADSAWIVFLVWGAIMSFVLMLDDRFMLHERLFPRKLGVPEEVVYGGYLIAAACWVWHCRRIFPKTHYGLLVAAGMLFAVKLVIDLFPPGTGGFDRFLEGALKMTGIALWTVYAWATCSELLRRALTATPPPRAPASRRSVHAPSSGSAR